MRYLVLDTNILLHFSHIDEIPWRTLVADDITLVIAPVVFRELDKRRSSDSSSKTRDRAGAMIRLFSGLYPTGEMQLPKSRVPVRAHSAEPMKALSSADLDPSVNDDRLIATASEIGNGALFVTADVGAALKAKATNVEALLMPDHLRLPSEPAAKRESLQPKLHVRFENDDVHCEVRVSQVRPLSQEEVAVYMRELRKDHPKITWRHSPIVITTSTEEFEEYNRSLDRFFSDSERHLAMLHMMAPYDTAVRLDLTIHNDGTTAEDVDLHLRFPLACDEISRKRPRVLSLKAPELPGHRLTALLSADALNFKPMVPQTVRGPKISKAKSEGWDVRYEVNRIKAQRSQPLPPVFINLTPGTSGFVIGADYGAANLPSRTKGELQLVVKESDESIPPTVFAPTDDHEA